MIRLFTALLAIACTATASAGEPPIEKRILFLGDSITYGGRYIAILEAALITQYPETRWELLNLGLSSETVSGLSEPGHAGGKFPRPDLFERIERILPAIQPDRIIACYGMNDGIYLPLDRDRFTAYQEGIHRLRNQAAALQTPITHLTPPVYDAQVIAQRAQSATTSDGPFKGYNAVLTAYADWLLTQRDLHQWDVLDLHHPMLEQLHTARQKDPAFCFANDGVHPGDAGHLVMATPLLDRWGLRTTSSGAPDHPHGEKILALILKKQALLRDAWLTKTGHLRPGVKAGLPLVEAQEKAAALDREARSLARQKSASTFPGNPSEWHGFRRYDFEWAGVPATLVMPADAAPGRPWIWHGEFFGHRPEPDIALLEAGFHVAYLNIRNMLGCPQAVALWQDFYVELTTRYNLASKPGLVALSRGGLYCYNWAIAHPDQVACIYADAAVCDFKSWPGGFGSGKGDPTNWQRVLTLWSFADEAAALAYPGNPVDQLAPLAKHGVPLLHVFGDADDVVPWQENTGVIADRYPQLGGSIKLIRKPGVGHHPHGLDDPTPIIAFLRRNAAVR